VNVRAATAFTAAERAIPAVVIRTSSTFLTLEDARILRQHEYSLVRLEAATMARNDPLRNFRFRVEIDNVTRAGFAEVSGLEIITQAIDYREGTDPPHVRKLSGVTKYGNVTLKYGLAVGANALELFQWHRAIAEGQLVQNRRRVVIVVQDESGQDQTRFVVSDAWPVKYETSPLSARASEVIIETLELANEGIERVQ
jgi:phage tail-like protein